MQAVLDFSNDDSETVWRVRHADGEWRHLAILANNCLADPAVNGVVLNIRDVSGRTRAEAALRALNAELEQRVQQRTLELVRARDEAESANRAKSEFLSRMSHELRTPMHAILGFGQLLEADPALALAPASRSYLVEMLRAGERLLGLINELLDLARIDAGQLSLQAQAVDLAPLLHECLQTIAPLAQLHGVQLPQAPLLQGRVRADRERLKQVLLNLLSNAIKHNRPGGRVSVQAERDGDTWCISVSDTGPGLDAAQQERLFHAFERLGAGRTGVDGAGIGLALSKRLVELMQRPDRPGQRDRRGQPLLGAAAGGRGGARAQGLRRHGAVHRGQHRQRAADAGHAGPADAAAHAQRRDARGRAADRAHAAAGPDPAGHPAAGHRRLRGAAPAARRGQRRATSRSSPSVPTRCAPTSNAAAPPASTTT